ncbi:hypothetical protein [Pinibacter soli]|uniref:Cell division protein FtsL n=1 Tax=Pinibacter soli TaxID=3044211 RepID=A0ABT6RF64_9BACT|nr:hypothetical protein [Pinibacter soli]MDI3321106.1 hypothetical protein [Pinibacter soli]
MNLLELKISIVWFLLSFIILPFAGFIFRTRQLQQKQRRIRELEQEMVSNHAEILSLHGQLATRKTENLKTVAIKENASFVENSGKGKLKVSSM